MYLQLRPMLNVSGKCSNVTEVEACDIVEDVFRRLRYQYTIIYKGVNYSNFHLCLLSTSYM